MQKTRTNGFTFLEVMLAFAIGAVALATLTATFETGRRSWRKNTQRAEMIQHGQAALSRMTSEMRYATQLVTRDIPNQILEFDTNNLVDADEMTTERIRYQATGDVLDRSVDGGVPVAVAGRSGEVKILLETIPLKLNASGDMVPLAVADPLSLAIAVDLYIRAQALDTSVSQVDMVSRVTFRNK
ncbi:MAG: prepilin-type N-terminal cleavage/methylation domain-containing protein [Candidatus Omnitrophota bacterium]|nr:prepilin-type N-terminal cleavage/methylation domain-containing protein [Candidatus Omnitrophota bacterium]MDZ4243043.1 prepilin-type N-terminal cleavage/methylation domain-containing protein [Candidatus Omnitrophota bacterium]